MRTFYKLSCSVLLVLARILFTPSVSAQAPTVAPGRVFAEPQPSTSYAENVTNIHWRRGNGTNYIVLIREMDYYSSTFMSLATPGVDAGTPTTTTGNGRMEPASNVPYNPNPFNARSTTYVLRTGTYGSAADTTASVQNAMVGMYYEVTVFEFNTDGAGAKYYTKTRPVEFRQPRITPRITRTSLDPVNRPIVTFQIAAELLTSLLYVSWSSDSTSFTTMPVQVAPAVANTTGYTYTAKLPVTYTGAPLFIRVQLQASNRPSLSELRNSKAVPFTGVFTSFLAAPSSAASTPGTELKWTVPLEADNVSFQVQQSLDSLAWTQVATIPSRGDSRYEVTYSHVVPAAASAYYRILQIGQRQLVTGISPLRRVVSTPLATASGAARPSFSAYPNPARTQVHLDGLDRNYPVEVLNALGQVVRQEQPGQMLLAVQDLPRGLYVLRQGTRSTRLTLE